jgi:hypothetical protein
MFGQCSGEQFEVVHVAGQDRLRAAYGQHHEVGVDDITGARARQQVSDFGSVVEGEDEHRFQKSREACLSTTVAPHLGDHGVRRRQWRLVDECGGEEFLRSAFTSIDRDEEPGVKNQGDSGCSWLRPLVRRPGLPPVPSLRGGPQEPRAVGFRRRGGEARRGVRSIGHLGSRPCGVGTSCAFSMRGLPGGGVEEFPDQFAGVDVHVGEQHVRGEFVGCHCTGHARRYEARQVLLRHR